MLEGINDHEISEFGVPVIGIMSKISVTIATVSMKEHALAQKLVVSQPVAVTQTAAGGKSRSRNLHSFDGGLL